jgi:hypothetical protein
MASFDSPFQAPQPRAQWASYALIAGMVLSVAGIIASLLQISRLASGASIEEGEFTLADGFQALVGLATLGVYIITIILFLLWFHGVSRNLKPLGVRDQQHSPGWAVGSWFVPFANLFIPYRIAKEIWLKSDTNTDEYGFLKTESTIPSFFGYWWGLWITSNITQNAAARLTFSASSADMLSVAEWLSILGDALSIGAAIFVLRVIKDITARQEESAARIPNYGAPPPPPVYESSEA